MAPTNSDHESSRSDDDAHDRIGSISATPTGVATPRPDLTDKRLPEIMHGYFGQVRKISSTSSPVPSHCALVIPALDTGVARYTPSHYGQHQGPGNALPTAPCSPAGNTNVGEDQALPLLPHEHMGILEQEAAPYNPKFFPYPTPPASSSSSFTHKEKEDGVSTGGIKHSGNGSTVDRPPFGRHQSATDFIPLRTRRHTAGLKSLSGIITSSAVHAAHISNPTVARSSTTPSTPTRETHRVSALSSLTSSYLELAKLTERVAVSPRKKNTPPHTPRALSNDGSEKAHKPPPPTSNPTLSPPDDISVDGGHHDTLRLNGSSRPTATNTAPRVGPPKGKLSVKMIEARGLRPSYDPYVVCVFEWNEYISKGPRHEVMDIDKADTKHKEDAFGGVAIKRSASDMGRAMAIPMKSRQSSTTSLSDQKNFKTGRQVTDPKWQHDAIL